MKLTNSSKTNYLLGSINIFSYYDVLNHLPRKYESFILTKENGLKDKERIVFYGKIISSLEKKETKRINIISFNFETVNKNTFKVIAFNRDYLTHVLRKDEYYTLVGTFDKKNFEINLINIYKGNLSIDKSLKPIYSLPSSLEQRTFISLVDKSFKELDEKIYDDIPYFYINKYRLGNKKDALNKVHKPKTLNDVKSGLRYLKYEEALKFSLMNQIIREENKSFDKIKKEPIDLSLATPFLETLPYQITEDQKKACEEIINDMNSSYLMYRMLQGDVGTGKTLVALICLYVNRLRGDQGALMAPTDALAKQHYLTAKEIFKNTKLNIALLTGSSSKEEKNHILSDLEDGTLDIIIGTHSLFSKGVKYSSLGLAIIDEQHRFGVNQRSQLMGKGEHTDILMLSATPIPRSLALTLYGDLDVSTLEVFPSKKRDVLTKIVDSKSDYIFKAIDRALELNKSVYIIAPKIEFNDNNKYSVEKLFEEYKTKYQDKISFLHGKLNKEEKEKALNDFYNGNHPILISTQVVEVGIDQKNAILMVIYDASNFGLAALHQLRGRIGRDGSRSLCLLVFDEEDIEKRNRLETIVNLNDGFKISEIDLKLRGPGELTGLRQSGLPEFHFLNLSEDINIFITARNDAKSILEHKEDKAFKWFYSKIKTSSEDKKDTLI